MKKVGRAKATSYTSMRFLYREYLRKSRLRNIFWELPLEVFSNLTSKPCHYCGRPPHMWFKFYKYSGLDRKNNMRGYETKNVVPCCKRCNQMKSSTVSYEEMRYIGRAIKRFRERFSPRKRA